MATAWGMRKEGRGVPHGDGGRLTWTMLDPFEQGKKWREVRPTSELWFKTWMTTATRDWGMDCPRHAHVTGRALCLGTVRQILGQILVDLLPETRTNNSTKCNYFYH